MNRLLIACSAVLLLATFAVRWTPGVTAQDMGPNATGGSSPLVSVTVEIPGYMTETLYTVPADRVLVVTAFRQPGTLDLYQDSTLKVEGATFAMGASGPLGMGAGHLTFDPGSNLVMENIWSSEQWVSFEGYLAHP